MKNKHCGKCKTEENLIKSASACRKGKKFQYYICNPCNAKRMNIYYHFGKGKGKKLKWEQENKEKVLAYGYKWRLKNTEKVKEYVRKSYLKNGKKNYHKHFLKYQARALLRTQVKNGSIKKLPCIDCNSKENLQGHHEDYSKPLDVIWLCVGCHRLRHRKFKQEVIQ